ncbi:MAG: transposase [Anaerolineales bacterium]|nr:transposase [Anaerolineales bacterium]
MTEIVALLQSLAPVVAPTVLKQVSQVIYGMLITNGRLTLLEISRWTERGGSYRTIQRWYHSKLVWLQSMWILFTSQLWKAGHEYIAAGDEVVFGNAGKETQGVGYFFSGLQQRIIPGLSFFVFSLIDVNERQSYPIQVSQIVKPIGEKTKPDKKEPAKVKQRSKGRPKGSQNKKAEKPILSPELLRIQSVWQAFLTVLKGVLSISYLGMDGHFGNDPSAGMVRQTGLQFVSKLRHDAARYEPCSGKYRGRGPHPKYGDKIDVHKMKKKYLNSDTKEQGIRTQIYQATLLNKEFAFSLNVVVILKTNLSAQAQAHVILFSTDLQLSYEKMIDYYSLRFIPFLNQLLPHN